MPSISGATATSRSCGASGIERGIKERLQHFAEEITFAIVEDLAHEIDLSVAPFGILIDAEPTFFLQEVQEDDLPQKFLGELFGGEFFIEERRIIFKQVEDLQIFSFIDVEEFLGDAFDAESLLKVVKGWQIGIVIENREELLLSRPARFIQPDEEGTAFSGRDFLFNAARFNESVFDFDEREPPFIGRGIGIESGNGTFGIVAHNRLDEISLDGAGAVDRFIFIKVDGEHDNFISAAAIVAD